MANHQHIRPPRERLPRYLDSRRIERAVIALRDSAGLTGDIYTRDLPPIGTWDEENRIIDLLGALPLDLRRSALAVRMVRAAVLGGRHDG